ncbi:MAG: penicillin-binding transpeptidase domain-containing protein, partial [Brevundimonas sp.]|nr:penicillin-binding transpeptidase domain-containing protein [Brevundimonas sp.]
MSVQPHPSSVRRPAGRRPRLQTPSWRWLAEGVWWVEHSFERARAHARPEEDSRVRIFLVLAAFGLVFAGLGLKAGYAALFQPVDVGYRGAASDRSRADLVDRNGRLLATDVIFYAMFIDPSQVWDRDVAYREIRRVMPGLDADRLKGAIWGERPVIVASGLTPDERARVHGLGLGGVTFAMEDGRVYPLEGEAKHLIGATDTGGQGISGVELAFDKELRAEGAGGAPFELSIDLRIQGVVESELATAMGETNAKAGVAIVTNVQTGEVLAMASWPETGSRNLATSGHYEMGSVFKSFA